MTRVLAFDPGPTMCGWCCIEGVRTYVSFVDGGRVESDSFSVKSVIRRYNPQWVAVETVSGYAHEHARSAQLNATAAVAGGIVWLAHALGVLTVKEMPAAQWRKILCGNGHASDDAVRREVKKVTQKMPTRSNAHVRDALGLAIVAFWSLSMTDAQRKLAKANGDKYE